MARKDKVVDDADAGVEFLFRKNKVDWLKGRARIAGPAGSRSMTRPGGRGRRDRHRHRLREHPAAGAGDRRAAHRVLDRRAGAGPGAGAPGGHRRRLYRAGARLGVARLGARSRWWSSSTASCPAWTASSARRCSACWRARHGVQARPPRSPAATVGNEAVTLELEPAAGGERESLAADVVLVAIGRRPFTDGLGLDEIGRRARRARPDRGR